MKILLFAVSVLTAAPGPVIAAPADQSSALTAPTNTGPKIQFDNESFDAGKIPAGKALNHTFIFTNIGNQTLEVTKVTGTCHCTVVDNNWTRRVEPGQTGTILITIDVRPEWAGTMGKTILVEANDKSRPPSFPITINFSVWKPVDVSQPYVFLNVPAESTNEVSTTVRVDNNTSEPLAVYDAQSSIPAITVQLKTNEPGKHYELLIRAAPPFASGSASSQITAKTSSTNVPIVSVNASVSVQPLIAVNPPQVVLDPGPLTNIVQKSVTLVYQGSGALRLSSGAVNAQFVDVQIAESQPGKVFTVTVSFPSGYESSGKPIELTLNTSSPRMPVIKVPIYQFPRIARTVPQTKPSSSAAATPPSR